MLVNASINKTSIFVSLELEDCIIHQWSIEYTQSTEHIEVGNAKTSHLFEEAWLQLCNNILETSLTIVCKVHKDRNSSSKLDEFFLNLLAFALDLFFLSAKLFFIFLTWLLIFSLCFL